jgi:hypothetical protein
MRPRKSLSLSVRESSQTTASYGLDIKPPFDLLYVNVKPSDFTFEEAYDELGSIDTIMRNHVTRTHGLPLPNPESIIDLLEHIFQTIKVALSRIGSQLPDEVSQSSHYTSDEKKLEANLHLAYIDWCRFIDIAKYQCERLRPVSIPSTSETVHYPRGPPLSPMEKIIEGNQWNVPRQGRRDTWISTDYSEKSRRVSRDVSPRTRASLPSGVRTFAISTIAHSTVERPVKMYQTLRIYR